MAINKLSDITTPNPVSGDWAKMAEILFKSYQNINSPLQVDGSNIPQGSAFQVGGVPYYGDTDTAISGTVSDYVKLTVSGTTLVPSFVADLTGVSWNKIYNGYYDVSGNFYLFNEARAIADGEISVSYTSFGDLWDKMAGQSLTPADNVAFAAGAFSGALTATSLDTGQGANELYDMDQNVKTTNNVQFASAKVGTLIYHVDGATGAGLYNSLKDFIPSVGDKILLSGAIIYGGNGYVLSYANRTSTSSIRLYGIDDSFSNDFTIDINSSSSTSIISSLVTGTRF